MKAYYVHHFTMNPKIMFEDGNIIDLYNNPSDPTALMTAIYTVTKDYHVDEVVVNYKQDQEMFEHLNNILAYSDNTKMKITLQEN